MFQFSRWSIAGTALITAGLTAGATISSISSTAVSASPNTGNNFSDVQNQWAQPFIQQLTERKIIAGYPDGTFQPDRPVRRDEYAAILRQAFNQAAERRIASGSVYQDVPQGYWAAPAIEEAYEMGFMQGYPGGYFKPDASISRVEVLVSLAKNLNLNDAQSARTPATQPQAANSAPQANNAPQANAASSTAAPQASAAVQPNAQANAQANAQQSTSRSRNRRPFALYPMAMTTLMQPFVNNSRALAANLTAPAAANSDPAAAAQNPTAQNPTPQTAASQPNPAPAQQPVALAVSNFYADADQIPQYAVDAVAQATRAGIVVNYPETNLLNPNRPATRAEVAAFIHQALVDQGRLQPLPNQAESAKFVVKPQQ